MLNVSATSMALGVASRTGLLKALGADPLTSSELAAKAEMAPRYVEEILAALVCGEIVVLAGDDPLRYSLPAERKAALDGMGLYFEELPLLSQCAFAEVCIAAKTGSGVDPSCYQTFGSWMGALADAKHGRQLTQKFLPALANGAVVEALNAPGAAVMDLGCGTGTAARLIAAAFPTARVVGVDVDSAAIETARAHTDTASLKNLEFIVADASTLTATSNTAPGASHSSANMAATFDLVLSFDAIHDLADPSGAMRSARSLLKPEGLFAMVDIRAATGLRGNLDHSMGAFLYTVSLMHCMPQGLNCDSRGQPGAGLGMMWGRDAATQMLSDAGFGSIEVVSLEFDSFNDVYLARCTGTHNDAV